MVETYHTTYKPYDRHERFYAHRNLGIWKMLSNADCAKKPLDSDAKSVRLRFIAIKNNGISESGLLKFSDLPLFHFLTHLQSSSSPLTLQSIQALDRSHSPTKQHLRFNNRQQQYHQGCLPNSPFSPSCLPPSPQAGRPPQSRKIPQLPSTTPQRPTSQLPLLQSLQQPIHRSTPTL